MPTPKDPIPRLEAVRNRAVEARNELLVTYSGLDRDDPRIVVARHIKAVLSATYLSLIHVHENLQEKSWWRRQKFDLILETRGAVEDELEDYMVLLLNNLVVYPFSLFEAGLRRVGRAIDPQACSGGSGSFKAIYDWLFSRLGKTGWTNASLEPVAFLDVYRNVRNTVHNNAKFYSNDGRNASVLWRGTQYDFVYGKVPAFVGWDFVLVLVDTLIELNSSVAQAPAISSLPPIP